MVNLFYKIYAANKNGKYDLISKKKTLEEAQNKARSLNSKIYEKYIIVECNKEENSEFPIECKDLSIPTKVVYEDFKSKYKIETSIVKPVENKLVKMVEKYIESEGR